MGVALRVNQAVLSLFSLCGITGNCLVIALILKKFKFESWTYILVCHLALTDLLTCAVGAPLWIATYTTKQFPVCIAAIVLSAIPIMVSSFTLILIAYDRYIFIRYPLRHPNIVTCRKIVTSLALCWSFALGNAALIARIGIRPSGEFIRRHCVLSLLVNRWVLIGVFAGYTLLPIAILILVYSYILRTALRQQRKVHEFTDIDDHKAKIARARKERRTIFMLCAVVAVFTFTTLPYSITALLDALNKDILKGDSPAYLTSMLLYFNAVINPFLYTLTNRDLRKQACKVFHRE